MSERRRSNNPYRVRRASPAEFSRVTAMLHADILALTEKVAEQDAKIAEYGDDLKKMKSLLKRKKSKDPEPVEEVE